MDVLNELNFLNEKLAKALDEVRLVKDNLECLVVECENLKTRVELDNITDSNSEMELKTFDGYLYNVAAVDCCIKNIDGVRRGSIAIAAKSQSIFNICCPIQALPGARATLMLELFAIFMAIKIFAGKVKNLCLITDSQEAFILTKLAFRENDYGELSATDSLLENYIDCKTISNIILNIRNSLKTFKLFKLFWFKKRDINDSIISDLMGLAHSLANKGLTDADFTNIDIYNESDFDSDSDGEEDSSEIDNEVQKLCLGPNVHNISCSSLDTTAEELEPQANSTLYEVNKLIASQVQLTQKQPKKITLKNIDSLLTKNSPSLISLLKPFKNASTQICNSSKRLEEASSSSQTSDLYLSAKVSDGLSLCACLTLCGVSMEY